MCEEKGIDITPIELDITIEDITTNFERIWTSKKETFLDVLMNGYKDNLYIASRRIAKEVVEKVELNEVVEEVEKILQIMERNYADYPQIKGKVDKLTQPYAHRKDRTYKPSKESMMKLLSELKKLEEQLKEQQRIQREQEEKQAQAAQAQHQALELAVHTQAPSHTHTHTQVSVSD